MQNYLNQIMETISNYVPNLLAALAVLLLGWLVALIISAVVKGLIQRTTAKSKLSNWVEGEKDSGKTTLDRYISKGIFYLIMLFVLVAFFQTLGLTIITEPLNNLLNQVFVYTPQLIGALALLLVAWIIAASLRLFITKALTAAKVDERLGTTMDLKETSEWSLTKALANAAYWLVFLLFLPPVLTALAIEGPLGPVQSMLTKILDFLPNIFTAAVVLLLGWFVAKFIQSIVSNLFAAVGTDQFSERVGLKNVLGKQKLSGVLGMIVYILILIPIIISALEALSLDMITQPATNMLNMILSALPALFAAALIIVVSYIIGKLVANLVSNLLANLGFDGLWIKLGLAKEEVIEKKSASEFMGYLVLVGILFFAAIEALDMLNFNNVAAIFTGFITFAGQVLLGLIIFTIGLFLANLVSNKVKESKSQHANLLSMISKVAILVLVGSMSLQQMGFGEEIVLLAFGLFFGAVAIAAAIAFGVGGRDLAAKKLENWNSTFKNSN
jgi:hypothetical protein